MRTLFFKKFKILILFATIYAEASPTASTWLQVEDQAKLPRLSPSLQAQKTAKIRLKNGVEAYIISNPDIKQSGASVSVKTGSWNDPKEFPGLAHFVEHLLFMGTKAYPDEGNFMRYIAGGGGATNAFTSTDHTLYMFSVDHKAFIGALDRLAHFFIDPLLCTSSVERELQAIDQEFAKNLEHDGWRQYMVMKELSAPEHPYSQFSTGNTETLRKIPEDFLRGWFLENYTPHKIRVVVLSALPLEELIIHVSERFSLIPEKDTRGATRQITSPLFSSAQKGSWIFIEPIRDLKELSLHWELPSSLTSPAVEDMGALLAHLFSSPHEEGLIHTLREKGWIHDAYIGTNRLDDNTLCVEIAFPLTDKGLSYKDAVIKKTFESLSHLQKIDPRPYFEELKKLRTLSYQYQNAEAAFDTVTSLGRQLIREELSTFPERSYIPGHFSSSLFSELLASLTKESCSYVLAADPTQCGYTPQRIEKWMGVRYDVAPLDVENFFASAMHPQSPLILPPMNPFIPNTLTLIPQEETRDPLPSLLVNSSISQVYYQRDSLYNVPELSTILRIHSSLMNGSTKSAVLTELFCSLFQKQFDPTLYMASSAGLHAALAPEDLSIKLLVQGYSEKAPLLLEKLFRELKTFQSTKENFLIEKERLKSAYGNHSKELPVVQASQLIKHLLLSLKHTPAARKESLETVSYEDFVDFSKRLFHEIFLEALIYGNCSKEEALHMASLWEKILQASAMPDPHLLKNQVRLLPEKEGPFVVTEKTESSGKATILAIQLGSFSYESRAMQLLMERFIPELFFEELRTKQQTGYIAKSKGEDLEGELTEFFLVQSNTHQPSELLARFDLFLDELSQEIDTLIPKDSFLQAHAMLLHDLSQPPENMDLLSQHLFSLGFDYGGDFTQRLKLIASLEKITYEAMKLFVREKLSRNNRKRLAVLMEGVLPSPQNFTYQKLSKEEVAEMGELVSRELR